MKRSTSIVTSDASIDSYTVIVVEMPKYSTGGLYTINNSDEWILVESWSSANGESWFEAYKYNDTLSAGTSTTALGNMITMADMTNAQYGQLNDLNVTMTAYACGTDEWKFLDSAWTTIRDAGEFKPEKPYQREPMNNFPYDCCDDTADLFIHYLYHTFRLDSLKVTGSYYSKRLNCTCYHTWQEFEGWVIDLTGDQFDGDSDIRIKTIPVYVGTMSDFHKQFKDLQSDHSCGIECLGSGSHERMHRLYDAVMKHLE